MTTYGNLFAGGARYDVVDAGSSTVAKFSLNGTYYGTRKSANQTTGGVSFTVKGVAYCVNPAATTGPAKIKIGSTIYFIVVAAGTPAPSPTPTPTPAPVVIPPTPIGTLIRPEAKTTGAILGPALKQVQGFRAVSGTVYQNLRVVGTVNCDGLHDVMLINCDINGPSYAVSCVGATGITIKNCTLHDVGSAGVHGDGFSAIDCHVYHSSGDGFKPGHDVLIQGCYVAELGWNAPTAHADGVQIRGGKNVRIVGNYFDMGKGVPNTGSNAAIFVQKFCVNIVFDRNWNRGGNYTIHLYPEGGTGCAVTNNIFYTGSAQYGFKSIGSGVVWSGNVTETGKPVG